MTHTTETETKKPKRRRNWIIIGAILFIIFWIIGVNAEAENDDTPEPSAEQTPTQEPTEETEPTVEPEPEEEPEETEAAQEDPEPEPSETEEPTPEERQETDNGLDPVHAQVACTQQAEAAAYPDKLKVHTVMGKKQEVINADEIRFLWEATLTSGAGGEIRGEVLCVATGSNDAPTVEIEFR